MPCFAAPKTQTSANFESTGTLPGSDADTIEVVTTAVEGQMTAMQKRIGHVLAKVSVTCLLDIPQTPAMYAFSLSVLLWLCSFTLYNTSAALMHMPR
jgi:hypothetical protein